MADKYITFSTMDEGVDYPTQAKQFVLVEANDRMTEIRDNINDLLKIDDVYVVSFAYILGGWKAMVSTSVPDGKYYEVTHNASKQETYVDTYIKVRNTKYSLEGDTK